MKIDFEYRELITIKEVINNRNQHNWLKLSNRIKKGTSFEEVKAIKKEFDENVNPWTEEGRCNSILKKIEDFETKVAKLMDGQNEN